MRVAYLFHILFQNRIVFLQSSASPVLQGKELLSFLSFVLEFCGPDGTAPPFYIPKHLWNSTRLGWWDFIAMLHQKKWWNRSLVSSTCYLHWILSKINCFIKIGRHVKRTLEDSFHCTLQYTELPIFVDLQWNEILYLLRGHSIFFFLVKNLSCVWQHAWTWHQQHLGVQSNTSQMLSNNLTEANGKSVCSSPMKIRPLANIFPFQVRHYHY